VVPSLPGRLRPTWPPGLLLDHAFQVTPHHHSNFGRRAITVGLLGLVPMLRLSLVRRQERHPATVAVAADPGGITTP